MGDNPLTYRSKGERIAYLRGEVARLQDIVYPEHGQEVRDVCIAALNERVLQILDCASAEWADKQIYK